MHPGTPTSVTGTFPAGIRVARRPPPGSLGTLPLPPFQNRAIGMPAPTSAFSAFGPPSPGLHPVFAKKKRSVFKGPNIGVSSGSRSGNRTPGGSEHGSRGTSIQGRPSGEMAIAEEDEEEVEDEGRDEFLEVEEVEAFSPVAEDEKAFHVEGEDSDEEPEVIGTLMEEEDEHEIAAVDPPQRDVVAIAEQEQQQARQQS